MAVALCVYLSVYLECTYADILLISFILLELCVDVLIHSLVWTYLLRRIHKGLGRKLYKRM